MSNRGWKFLADLVFVSHMVLVLILLGGSFAILSGLYLQYPHLMRIHGIITAATLISQIIFLGCPLVTLESALRNKYRSKPSTYYGSFVVYFLMKLTGVKVPVILVTTGMYMIVVIAVIGYLSVQGH